MRLHRFTTRAAALLALAAIALQPLWPLLAHGTPAPRSPAIELCSADGVPHRAAIPADGGAPPAGHALCGHCLTGCERGFVAPGAAPGTSVATPLANAHAPAAGAAQFRSCPYPPARSRAPPRAC